MAVSSLGSAFAHVETGAGAITAKFIASGEQRLGVETGVGDVTVYLVPNINITVRATIEAGPDTVLFPTSRDQISSEGGQWSQVIG